MIGPSYNILVLCVLLQCSLIAPFVASSGEDVTGPFHDWVDMQSLLRDRGEDSPSSFTEVSENFPRRTKPAPVMDLGARHPLRRHNIANQFDLAGSIDPSHIEQKAGPFFPTPAISEPDAYADTPMLDTDDYLAEGLSPRDLKGFFGNNHSLYTPSSFAGSATSDDGFFSQDGSPLPTYDDLFAQDSNFFLDDVSSSRQETPSLIDASSPSATRASKRPVYHRKKIAALTKWECPYYGQPSHHGCQRYFKTRANMRRHTLLEEIRSGKTTRNGKEIKNIFQCASCGMKWPKRSLLQAHEKTHVGDFACDYCSETNKTEQDLREHMAISACKRKRLSQDVALQALL